MAGGGMRLMGGRTGVRQGMKGKGGSGFTGWQGGCCRRCGIHSRNDRSLIIGTAILRNRTVDIPSRRPSIPQILSSHPWTSLQNLKGHGLD